MANDAILTGKNSKGSETSARTDLSDFRSKLKSQYTPRSDRFEVEFKFPEVFSSNGNDIRSLSVMCEEAQIPGYATTNFPVKIGAWTEFRSQNIEFLTQESVFTFIADQGMLIRDMFERWMQHTVDPVSKEVSWYDESYGSVVIRLLNTYDNVEAEWVLHEAMPKLINVTPLAWSNSQHVRVSVSMVAKYWSRGEVRLNGGGTKPGPLPGFTGNENNSKSSSKDFFKKILGF